MELSEPASLSAPAVVAPPLKGADGDSAVGNTVGEGLIEGVGLGMADGVGLGVAGWMGLGVAGGVEREDPVELDRGLEAVTRKLLDSCEDDPGRLADTLTWWLPTVASAGTAKVGETLPSAEGWHCSSPTTSRSSNRTSQGIARSLISTVTWVPGGPSLLERDAVTAQTAGASIT